MGIEKTTLTPLTFAEDRHETIWGHERWLVSAHPSAPSVVADGPFANRRLDELCGTFGADLVGTRPRGRFPLLIKDIAAARNLSVQVHPNERTCRMTGGDPKAEMWHVLDSEPGGVLFAGLRKGTSRADLEKAIADGTVENIILRHAVREGENLFIPGGLVHALGGGVRVLEVQQSSDTTFRLYDWGRVGADGQPRKLHVREGLDAVDPDIAPITPCGDFECPFFRVRILSLQEGLEAPADPGTFRVLAAAHGAFALESSAGRQEIAQGGAILIPAAVSAAATPLTDGTRLLEVSLQ